MSASLSAYSIKEDDRFRARSVSMASLARLRQSFELASTGLNPSKTELS